MKLGSLATQLRLTFGLFLALLGAVLFYHVRSSRATAKSARELSAQSERHQAVMYEQVRRLSVVHAQLERFIVRGGAPASARDTATSMVVSLDQASRRMEDQALSIVGAMEGSLADAERMARRAQRMALAIAMSAFVASVLLSLALMRAILRPLDKLTEGTRELATGRFAHRLPDAAPAEFAGVARDFNAMAGRLEELDRLKKDFVSTVSHDLKTPLSSMQETVEVLLEEIPGPLTPRQRKLLELNRESARRLAQMLAKLLDLSRLNAESSPQRDVIDLAAIVRDTVERFDVARPGRGPTMALIAPVTPLWVRANASGIGQVLENLIENAIKFSPAGGTIRVAVADLPANGTVLLSVADEGPGVPDSEKDRVFDRFHQAPTGRAAINRGVGLGLSICRHIVDAHDGMIWVADHEPRGSVFCVLIPGPAVSVESAADRILPPMRRLLAGGVIIAAMTACLGSTEALPLNVSIQAPASGNTTDSVSIVVTAQGNSLVGIAATFGDGGQSAFATGGARTATVTFRHLYTQSGTYQVTATVTDAVLGEKGASAQLSIQ